MNDAWTRGSPPPGSFIYLCRFAWQGVGKSSLLTLFGLNAKGMPRVQLRHPQLPVFYNATFDKGKGIGQVSCIEENIVKAIEALGVRNSRNFCICFDDSVYWPTYSILYWPEPVIVGGFGPKAWIPLPDDADLNETMDGLEREFLATQCITWLVSRADSNQHAYDVCMRPRKLKQVTASSILEEAGRMWSEATSSNGGIPPLSQSCDNHASQVSMNAMFAGLMAEKMATLPFLPSIYWQLILIHFVDVAL